jgi:hypothetical protein
MHKLHAFKKKLNRNIYFYYCTSDSEANEETPDGLGADLTLVHARVLNFGFTNLENPLLGLVLMNSLMKY